MAEGNAHGAHQIRRLVTPPSPGVAAVERSCRRRMRAGARRRRRPRRCGERSARRQLPQGRHGPGARQAQNRYGPDGDAHERGPEVGVGATRSASATHETARAPFVARPRARLRAGMASGPRPAGHTRTATSLKRAMARAASRTKIPPIGSSALGYHVATTTQRSGRRPFFAPTTEIDVRRYRSCHQSAHREKSQARQSRRFKRIRYRLPYRCTLMALLGTASDN